MDYVCFILSDALVVALNDCATLKYNPSINIHHIHNFNIVSSLKSIVDKYYILQGQSTTQTSPTTTLETTQPTTSSTTQVPTTLTTQVTTARSTINTGQTSTLSPTTSSTPSTTQGPTADSTTTTTATSLSTTTQADVTTDSGKYNTLLYRTHFDRIGTVSLRRNILVPFSKMNCFAPLVV
jgi:hypothetical protein